MEDMLTKLLIDRTAKSIDSTESVKTMLVKLAAEGIKSTVGEIDNKESGALALARTGALFIEAAQEAKSSPAYESIMSYGISMIYAAHLILS